MFRFLKTALLLCALLICDEAEAYIISGTFKNVQSCYYPRVYLEVIKNIDGFYGSDANNLIAFADVDAHGNFVLKGKDLPEDKLYYRLYVTNATDVKSALTVGTKRNYILLLLDDRSDIVVNTEDFCEDNFVYTVSNSPENMAISSLQNLLLQYMGAAQKSITVTKQEFLVRNRHDELKHFADTCSNALVGLIAVAETDIEAKYEQEKSFFLSFLARLEKEQPQSAYTKQFKEALQLAELKKDMKEGKNSSSSNIILNAGLILSVLLNIYLLIILARKKQLRKTESQTDNSSEDEEKRIRVLIETLSIKEREILLMVHEGLSNKEIADRQNVEVSTVKTHVSRIYQKTGISSRKEVAAIAKYL